MKSKHHKNQTQVFRNSGCFISLLISLTFCVSSCDVSRQLLIKNDTPYEVKINLGAYNRSFSTQIDSLFLLNDEVGNNQSLIYGLGGWSYYDVNELKKEVSVLHIGDSLIIRDNTQINEWIKVKRKFLQKIKVTIKEPDNS